MSVNTTDVIKHWLIAITVVFTLSPTLIFFAFTSNEKLSTRQKIESRNQALTTSAIMFLGWAVLINGYYAGKRTEEMQKRAIAAEKNLEFGFKNTQIAQEHLITERLMTAITQLGHESVATRTGAIYALERVAQDSAQEYWTIMEILTAFIRDNTSTQVEQQSNLENISTFSPREEIGKLQLQRQPQIEVIPTDIQAALTVIGRRNAAKDPENQKLNLRNADIKGADLQGANLERADLRGANLCGANLRSANLFEAELDGANLSESILYEANLQLCNLQGANLYAANLNRCVVIGANLRAANLSGASLRAANLSRTNLYKANLQRANLKSANLCEAKLFLANLQGAKLSKANLQGAGLIGANLQQANLNAANLQQANLNAANLQQAEIFFANFSAASLREADFSSANLMGANLQQAILHEAKLCGANLVAVNLSEANLCDVKLEGAILTGAKNLEPQQIMNALGDGTTQLPENFQPPTHWRQSG
ncbi:pentapeptide repeat-containing protein [Iningainema tapete]|uniref:Pentapeptide repeat-containing protein n=1 Tax=Iningainema tapete BLCC-T55 TaxID=2748662 RepID=A0A8J6XK74_9CYAN|nr:pentapeptide repeat-containing protein [Iningainema tapete]MBD2771907.1 pentapeptide repeat-containing protein [Iningainema tapete BLCC-T55]